jgi:hypothetical protein
MAQNGGAARARLLRMLAWWSSLFALWMLFTSVWSWQIAVWGAGLSGVAAVSADVVARLGLPGTRGRWEWCRELGPATVAVAVDFVIITGVLVRAIASRRREAGTFLSDDSAAGEGLLAAGRRAWVETVATLSPNCYVVDVSPDSGRRLIHDLRPYRSSERPS